MKKVPETVLSSFNEGAFEDCIRATLSYLKVNGEDLNCRKILAASYEKLGDTVKALDAYEICVMLSPNDPINHYNKGAILDSLLRHEAAAKSYTDATSLDKNFTVAWNNLGIVLRKLRRYRDSERALKNAIASDSNYAASYYNLGNLYTAVGRLNEALHLYSRAIELKPEDPLPYLNRGNALKELGDYSKAASNYKTVIELDSTGTKAIYNLGVLHFENQQIRHAARYFLKDQSANSQTYLLRCYHELDSETEFRDQLVVLKERGILNSTMGSLITRFNEKHEACLDNPFLNDPLSYVVKQQAFDKCETLHLLDQIENDRETQERLGLKKQELLISGAQTSGNLFDHESTWTTEIEVKIRECIDRYIGQNRARDEGYIKNWPKSYKLVSWLINMRTGGQIKPHIHENGWLGGAVYLQVPEKTDKHEGSFVVSLANAQELRSPCSQKVIDISAGDIVLFPASLLHHTIPFSSAANRIVIAFDLINDTEFV